MATHFYRGADLGTRNSAVRCLEMQHYFFHLVGDLEAHDLLGRDFENDKQAKEHATMLAHKVGTDKPALVNGENCILVKSELGTEVFRAPIASTLV
jgi:hypothetical protein